MRDLFARAKKYICRKQEDVQLPINLISETKFFRCTRYHIHKASPVCPRMLPEWYVDRNGAPIYTTERYRSLYGRYRTPFARTRIFSDDASPTP